MAIVTARNSFSENDNCNDKSTPVASVSHTTRRQIAKQHGVIGPDKVADRYYSASAAKAKVYEQRAKQKKYKHMTNAEKASALNRLLAELTSRDKNDDHDETSTNKLPPVAYVKNKTGQMP